MYISLLFFYDNVLRFSINHQKKFVLWSGSMFKLREWSGLDFYYNQPFAFKWRLGHVCCWYRLFSWACPQNWAVVALTRIHSMDNGEVAPWHHFVKKWCLLHKINEFGKIVANLLLPCSNNTDLHMKCSEMSYLVSSHSNQEFLPTIHNRSVATGR